MAIGVDLRAKKSTSAGAFTMTTLVVAVLLVLLACVFSASASNFEEVLPISMSGKIWGPSLRGSKAVGTDRVRGDRCDVFPSVCRGLHASEMACCGTSCVDLNSHSKHCGRCNYVCQAGRACCNGKCKSLSRDSNHCGTCSKKCLAGLRCEYGLCGY